MPEQVGCRDRETQIEREGRDWRKEKRHSIKKTLRVIKKLSYTLFQSIFLDVFPISGNNATNSVRHAHGKTLQCGTIYTG